MLQMTPNAREGLLRSLRRLSDDELVARLKGLAARERRATALLVAHLAELDTRDVYLRAGYSSLFIYCRDALGLSDDEAYNRIAAARTARRFPMVLDFLAAGDVTVTVVRLLAPHLTAENHVAVLESARGKRKADVEMIVARLSPRADVPASVRRLPEATGAHVETLPAPPQTASMTPTAAPVAVVSAASAQAASPNDIAGRSAGSVSAVDVVSHARRLAEVTPLSPDRYKYQLTIGGSTLEKLRQAKDMLRHALPSGDDEAILDRALTALLTELARQKFGGGPKVGSSGREARSWHKPSPGSVGIQAEDSCPPGADSRYVPVEVRRAVWVRDRGRCAFVAADGHRCAERAFVEFHHVRPWAAGGGATVENVQLRCWRHNAHEARVFFAREPRGDEGPREGTATAGERQLLTGVADPVLGSRATGGLPEARSGTGAHHREVIPGRTPANEARGIQ